MRNARMATGPVAAAAVALLLVGCGGPKPIYRADPRPSASDVKAAQEAKPSSSSTATRNRAAEGPRPSNRQIEEVTSTWLGTPYRYGGVGESGIDCSALAQNVMGDLGVTIPRTTRDQKLVGVSVPRHKLKPGDLLFFRLESSRINHVGIALGPDRFVHASSSRGVVVDRLMSDYFSRRFVEARRVLPQ